MTLTLRITSRLLICLLPFYAVSAVAGAAATSCVASDAKLHVITSGGFAAAYQQLAPQFTALSGIEIDTSFGSSSGGAPDSIPERLKRSEQFDVLILSRRSLDRLTAAGYVIPDSRTNLVESLIGMAVKEGATKPDISTQQAFIDQLMQAESIGYSASASGTYLSTVLWPKMGIWEQIRHKSRRIESERVALVVARGDVEIGFQQISEILPIEGAAFVGPIPDSLQKSTLFSTAITSNSENVAEAKCLIDYLSSLEVAPTIRSVGLSPVAELESVND
jgi:molybdate transport system substrate-binding protein